jgi:hypothetical protein
VTEPTPPPLPRLPRGARTGRLARVPIRLRGGSLTLSAWCLEVESDEGPGTITAVEDGDGATFLRGDGVFLGWTQPELAHAREALDPADDAAEADGIQLG